MIHAALFLIASQGTSGQPSLQDAIRLRKATVAVETAIASADEYISLSSTYKLAVEAGAKDADKLLPFVSVLIKVAEANLHEDAVPDDLSTDLNNAWSSLKKSYKPFSGIKLAQSQKLPQDVQRDLRTYHQLQVKVTQLIDPKTQPLVGARTSLPPCLSPDAPFGKLMVDLNAFANSPEVSVSDIKTALVRIGQANAAWKDGRAAYVVVAKSPKLPEIADVLKGPVAQLQNQSKKIDGRLKEVSTLVDRRVDGINEALDPAALLASPLSRRADIDKTEADLKVADALIATSKEFVSVTNDKLVPERIQLLQKSVDLLRAGLELLKAAQTGSLNGWVTAELKLFYYDNVEQLVQLLGEASPVSVGKGSSSVEARKELLQKVRDRSVKAELLSQARDGVNVLQESLRKIQLETTDRVQADSEKAKALSKKKEEIDSRIRDLEQEKSLAEAERTVEQRKLERIKTEITEVDAALAKQETKALVARRAQLEADRKSQEAKYDAADLKVADITASLERNKADSIAAVETESAELNALKQKLADKQKEVADAEGKLQLAQQATQAAAQDVLYQAKLESEAFAAERDSAGALLSRADPKSTDPLKRVFLYALPDRRIVIRGDSRDVNSAFRTIFRFDQPQAQAEMSLYSFEINTRADNGGRLDLVNQLGKIDEYSQRNDIAIQTMRDALRVGLVAALERKDGDSNLCFIEQNLSTSAKKRLRFDQAKNLIAKDLSLQSALLPELTGMTTLGEVISILSLTTPEVRRKTIARLMNELVKVDSLADIIPFRQGPEGFLLWTQVFSLANLFGADADFAKIPVPENYKIDPSTRKTISYPEAVLDAFKKKNELKSRALLDHLQTALLPVIQNLKAGRSAHVCIGKSPGKCSKSSGCPSCRDSANKSEKRDSASSDNTLDAFQTHLSNEIYLRGREAVRQRIAEWARQNPDKEDIKRDEKICLALTYLEITIPPTSKITEFATNTARSLDPSTASTDTINRRHTEIARCNEDLKNIMSRIDETLRNGITEPLLRNLYVKLAKTRGIELGFFQRQSLLVRNRLVGRIDPETSGELAVGEQQNILEDLGQLAALAGGIQSKQIVDIISLLKKSPEKPDAMRLYGVNGGSKFAVTPIFDPTGQAMRFRFDYVYSNQVTEPNGSRDPKAPQVTRNTINTEVQLSNFQLRRVAEFTSVGRLGIPTRRQGGIPILRDIKGLDRIPLIGWFVERRGQAAMAQHHILFTRAVMYPSINDVVDLLVGGSNSVAK